jgi:hypothetical protein
MKHSEKEMQTRTIGLDGQKINANNINHVTYQAVPIPDLFRLFF